MERCGDGDGELSTSAIPRSAVSEVLGTLRSIDTIRAPTSLSVDPTCTDIVHIGAAGTVRAVDIRIDNVANNN